MVLLSDRKEFNIKCDFDVCFYGDVIEIQFRGVEWRHLKERDKCDMEFTLDQIYRNTLIRKHPTNVLVKET